MRFIITVCITFIFFTQNAWSDRTAELLILDDRVQELEGFHLDDRSFLEIPTTLELEERIARLENLHFEETNILKVKSWMETQGYTFKLSDSSGVYTNDILSKVFVQFKQTLKMVKDNLPANMQLNLNSVRFNNSSGYHCFAHNDKLIEVGYEMQAAPCFNVIWANMVSPKK